MNESKSVAGQSELEALYSASRKADLPAEQHERLRGLAQSLMALLEGPTDEETNSEAKSPSDKDKKR